MLSADGLPSPLFDRLWDMGSLPLEKFVELGMGGVQRFGGYLLISREEFQ